MNIRDEISLVLNNIKQKNLNCTIFYIPNKAFINYNFIVQVHIFWRIG